MARTAAMLLIFLSAWAGPSWAACRCACVNGTAQPICQRSIDVPPVCAPMACGVVPPSVQPIQRPTVPPIGTSSCSQQQVQNRYTGRYEWQTICR